MIDSYFGQQLFPGGLYQHGREKSRAKYQTFKSSPLNWFTGEIFLQGKRKKI